MCLLVYGATGTGTASAGKDKDQGKAVSTKDKEAKGKSEEAKVEFDAPPSLLELLSTQHRTLTASVRTFLPPLLYPSLLQFIPMRPLDYNSRHKPYCLYSTRRC
jgi:hypothetical protein